MRKLKRSRKKVKVKGRWGWEGQGRGSRTGSRARVKDRVKGEGQGRRSRDWGLRPLAPAEVKGLGAAPHYPLPLPPRTCHAPLTFPSRTCHAVLTFARNFKLPEPLSAHECRRILFRGRRRRPPPGVRGSGTIAKVPGTFWYFLVNSKSTVSPLTLPFTAQSPTRGA